MNDYGICSQCRGPLPGTLQFIPDLDAGPVCDACLAAWEEEQRYAGAEAYYLSQFDGPEGE